MAEYLPVATGILAGLSAFGLLSSAAGARAPRRGPADAAQTIRRLVQRVGRAMPDAVLESPWIARCCREIAEVPWCRKLLLGSVDAPVPTSGAQSDALAGGVLCSVLAGAASSLLVSGSLVGAVVGAPLVPVALSIRSARRSRAEARRIEAAMPEAFASLAIALGSGHSLAQGMRFVGSHAQEPVRSEFVRVSLAVECGVPAAEALDELMERLPAPGMGFVSLALKISQRTGAPLRSLLAEAANMVAERIELSRRLDVKTSQARMSARMVAAMPVAMVCVLMLLSADFRAGLATPVGAGSVAVALALNVCAWLIIRRIMEVDIQ